MRAFLDASLDEFESHELNREKLSQAKGKLLFTLVRLNQAAKRQLLLENHQAIKYNAAWLIGVPQFHKVSRIKLCVFKQNTSFNSDSTGFCGCPADLSSC